MNEHTTIAVDDFKNGKIKEGIRYTFGCGAEHIVIAFQKINSSYWLKTQESEGLFDEDGRLMALTV